MTETTTPPIPRWRMITFWVLLVVLLFLHLGDRPQQLTFIVTAFGGFPAGEGATHEMHWFAQGVFAWSMVAAVAAQLRRPAAQVGAAWVYGAGTVLAFAMVLALAELPAEVVPIVAAAIVIAAIAFVAHPSSWRAKFTPIATPSRTLFALTAVAAWKVSGWRFPLWVAGLMAAALGVGSLGITAVSQLTTLWSPLAVVWGAAFIAVGELEARQQGPRDQPAPIGRRPVAR